MYVDVYGRRVDIGDVVSVAEAYTNIKQSVSTIGTEYYSKNKYLCYKLEEQREQVQGKVVLADALGWGLIAGDLVYMGFRQKKIRYGLIVGKNKCMLMNGQVSTFYSYMGIKIFNPLKEEQKIKDELIKKYNEYMTRKAVTRKIHSKESVQKGEVYLLPDNTSLYIYLGPCVYSISIKDKKGEVIETTITPNSRNKIFVKLSLKLNYTKELIEKVYNGDVVDFTEILSHMIFVDEKELKIFPYWDKELVKRLLENTYNILPFHSQEGYRNCMAIDYWLNFNEQISKGHNSNTSLVNMQYIKIKRNTDVLGSIQLGRGPYRLIDNSKVVIDMYVL